MSNWLKYAYDYYVYPAMSGFSQTVLNGMTRVGADTLKLATRAPANLNESSQGFIDIRPVEQQIKDVNNRKEYIKEVDNLANKLYDTFADALEKRWDSGEFRGQKYHMGSAASKTIGSWIPGLLIDVYSGKAGLNWATKTVPWIRRFSQAKTPMGKAGFWALSQSPLIGHGAKIYPIVYNAMAPGRLLDRRAADMRTRSGAIVATTVSTLADCNPLAFHVSDWAARLYPGLGMAATRAAGKHIGRTAGAQVF